MAAASPSDDIVIAPVTLDEVAEVAPLFDRYRVFYGQASSLQGAVDFLTKRLVNFESAVYLARAGAEAAGFAQMYPTFSSVALGPVWILNDLYVEPAFRRRGIARLLLHTAVAHARDDHARRIILQTAETNHAARALYEREGWTHDTQFRTYIRALDQEDEPRP